MFRAVLAALFILTTSPVLAENEEPLAESTTYNLTNTRLTLTVPEGTSWKNGEPLKCCKDNYARLSMFTWQETHNKNDAVRTQYGFKEVLNNPTRKANLIASYTKRCQEDMKTVYQDNGFPSSGLQVDTLVLGDGINALLCDWRSLNQHGVMFHIIQFEIWEGGQRDLIRFIHLVENAGDELKDENHALAVFIAKSLRLSRPESQPVYE